MDAAATQFSKFIMDRVKEDKKAEAQKLVNEAIEKVGDKKVDMGDALFLAKAAPQLLGMLKPEHVDEAKEALAKFMNQKK